LVNFCSFSQKIFRNIPEYCEKFSEKIAKNFLKNRGKLGLKTDSKIILGEKK